MESLPTVRDLGEQALLKRLQAFCPPEVIGDDGAVLAWNDPPGKTSSLVITTDLLVDGVHFSLGLATPGVHTTSPEDAGWRAAAANLSDLAAMGAQPIGITVGLGLPGEVPIAWVEEIYQGLVSCLHPHNTPIVGGDVCRSPIFTVAITAFGRVAPPLAIRRSAAQVGDAIVVTGLHGASRAGLQLLLHPEQGQALSLEERQGLIQAHQRPIPRLDVIPILQELWAAHRLSRSIAGMDSSDGLADAVLQLCRASGVGARLERAALPIPDSLQKITTPETALEWTLYGGEDFELVLCLPLEVAESLVSQLGQQAAVIGTIADDLEVRVYDPKGQEETLSLALGFQHF
ncbi:MAG: thiamine-phosphate kinase [Leptolyngbyaceae cyanobacterium bins.59]|nr:thiamine-phosphate kinase [Leptolyngbyaceae cyanobacterium bins.59]